MAVSNKKNRDGEFQNQITNFTAQLQEKVGFAKRGKPESKKKIRFSVCSKCDMKEIAQKYRTFSGEYLFPCICMNKNKLSHYNHVQILSDANVMTSVLSDLKAQCAVYFDMICVVEIAGYKYYRKISWKPLQENTWNRNNQPTCDNVRITAVSKAFVTIASTCWGDIELHAYGPETINKKPYARLGVGINMLSKHDWKPGFLFMTSINKNLRDELRLELKYPIQFEGKITVQWPRKGCETQLIDIFDINTNKNENTICPQKQSGFNNNNNDSKDIQMYDKVIPGHTTLNNFFKQSQENIDVENIELARSLISSTDEPSYRYSTTPETDYNFSDFHDSTFFNSMMIDNDQSHSNDIENWNNPHNWPSYINNDNINNYSNYTTTQSQPLSIKMDDSYNSNNNSHGSNCIPWNGNAINPDYMHSEEMPLLPSLPHFSADWPNHFNGDMDASTQNDVIDLAHTCQCCGSMLHNSFQPPF